MGWLDDLATRASQSIDNTENSAFSYFDDLVSDPAVIIGAIQGGNQTAAQIAAGQPGGPKAPVPAKAPTSWLNNAVGTSMFSPAHLQSMIPIIALAAAAYFIFAKKRGA